MELVQHHFGGILGLSDIVLDCFIPNKANRTDLGHIISSGALFLWHGYRTCPRNIFAIACRTGCIPAVARLFQEGFDRKFYCETVAHEASEHPDLLQWIYTHTTKGPENKSLLIRDSVRHDCKRTFDYLCQDQDPIERLEHAAGTSFERELLLEAFPVFSNDPRYQNVLLESAARCNSPAIVRDLTKHMSPEQRFEAICYNIHPDMFKHLTRDWPPFRRLLAALECNNGCLKEFAAEIPKLRNLFMYLAVIQPFTGVTAWFKDKKKPIRIPRLIKEYTDIYILEFGFELV